MCENLLCTFFHYHYLIQAETILIFSLTWCAKHTHNDTSKFFTECLRWGRSILKLTPSNCINILKLINVIPLHKWNNYFPDAPEIENEEAYIHTSEGDKTEVICIVHSSPKAEVTWYKDGSPLEPTSHIIDHRGNRHTLTIPGIEPAHFGTYSCKAQNQYGEDKKSTVVTGKQQDYF